MPEFFNPDIAMGVRVPAPPAQANPMELVSQFANAQRAMVDAQSASQVLAAHQRAGQIIASAPDFESGINAAMKDPLVAPFAGDVMSSLASTQGTMTSIAGAQQEQNLTALGKVFQLYGTGVSDPSTIMPGVKSVLDAMPPDVRARMEKPVMALTSSLLDGNPSPEELQKRFAAYATTAGGVSPDTIYSATGNVRPSIGIGPVEPGGALGPYMVGGPMTGKPNAMMLNGAPIQGPTIAEQAEANARGPVAGKAYEEMQDLSSTFPAERGQIEQLNQLLGMFKSGGGPIKMAQQDVGAFAKGLQNLGMNITPAQISQISGGDLGAQQLFDTFIKPITVSLLNNASDSKKRTAPELNDMYQAMNSAKDPYALRGFLSRAENILDYNQKKIGAWNDFTSDPSSAQWKGVSPDTFMSNFAAKNPIVKMPLPEAASSPSIDDLMKKYGPKK